MFTTGSNDKVWVGDAGGVQIVTDNFFADVFGLKTQRNNFFNGPDDFVTSSIVKGEGGGDGVITG